MEKDIALKEMPVIDWEQSSRLAGQNDSLAKEILGLLIKDLPSELTALHELGQVKNYHELQRRVHKLHGAVCYTGTPRLKMLLAQLETHLKNHIMDDLSFLLNQLDTEIHLLLEHYSRLSI